MVVADDDIAMTPERVGRMVRMARAYGLPVASASHGWEGKVSGWRHMMARGGGGRGHEPAGGVELCNFVEMTCLVMEAPVLRDFLDYFRRYADRLTGWGTDWLIANRCFSDGRPFGVMHNVTILNSRQRPGLPPGVREIELFQPTRKRCAGMEGHCGGRCAGAVRAEGLAEVAAAAADARISLEAAVERRKRITEEWIDGLGFPVQFFSAVDRRDLEAGRLALPYDDAAAVRRIGRSMTEGEIACVASHGLLVFEELEFCGPEGVFIMEDDCSPIPDGGAEQLFERVRAAVKALPGIEAVLCHRPWGGYKVRQCAGGAVRLARPPWGSVLAWYSPAGLRRALGLFSRVDRPADWIWREMCASGTLAMLDPPLASHGTAETTYIDSERRRLPRRFIP